MAEIKLEKCCKYKDSGEWCDQVKTGALIEVKGKKYCIFHAPKEHKQVSAKEFNEAVIDRARHISSIYKELSESQRISRSWDYCNFTGTIFPYDIDLSRLEFATPTTFNGCIFHGNVTFSSSTFEKDAFFIDTTFNGTAEFYSTKFSGFANFLDAIFSQDASFQRSVWEYDFVFKNAVFNKDLDFTAATIQKGEFKSNRENSRMFHGKLDFRKVDVINKVHIENANIGKALFSDTNMTKLDLIHCDFSDRTGRDMFYDEYLLYGTANTTEVKLGTLLKFLFSNDEDGPIKKVEIIYRQCKQKHMSEQNWPEVSNQHYSEKLMAFYRYWIQRKHGRFLFYLAYGILSGFGERPLRALFWLCISLIFLTYAHTAFVVAPSGETSLFTMHCGQLARCATFLVESFLGAVQFLPFLKATSTSTNSLLLKGIDTFGTIFVYTQFALFAIAIRNKLRR